MRAVCNSCCPTTPMGIQNHSSSSTSLRKRTPRVPEQKRLDLHATAPPPPATHAQGARQRARRRAPQRARSRAPVALLHEQSTLQVALQVACCRVTASPGAQVSVYFLMHFAPADRLQKRMAGWAAVDAQTLCMRFGQAAAPARVVRRLMCCCAVAGTHVACPRAGRARARAGAARAPRRALGLTRGCRPWCWPGRTQGAAGCGSEKSSRWGDVGELDWWRWGLGNVRAGRQVCEREASGPTSRPALLCCGEAGVW